MDPTPSEATADMALSDDEQATARRPPRSGLPGAQQSGLPLHKRTYQACIPCRRRKVRCDLGSVDDPHDPPCVRCRRESKDCFFSATRRKRQHPGESPAGVEGDLGKEYEIRNGRKRLRSTDHAAEGLEGAPSPRASHRPGRPAGHSSISSTTSTIVQHPLTPGGSVGQAQPLRRPASGVSSSISRQASFDGDRVPGRRYSPSVGASGIKPADAGEDDQQITAEKILQTGIYSGHDALNLLFEAAGRSGDIAHQREDGQAERPPPPAATAGVATSQPPDRTPAGNRNGGGMAPSYLHLVDQQTPGGSMPIDPAMSSGDTFPKPPADGRGQIKDYQDARQAWSNCRFVRAGWFTTQEAIAYIDYFYTYMAPLTPISPPTFHLPGSHSVLLAEEPILAVTLLTLSSRYMRLSGPGGLSRSYAIHEKLWNYLRGMIERIVWGQEQFSAGFGTAHANQEEIQTSSTAPWRGLRKGSMRTLGTVESLMLLTEWHPRALHFPPGDDGDELIVHDGRADVNDGSGAQDGDRVLGQAQKGVGGKRIESWLEPAWRSDRMCWMLLGNALALSSELGVFDPFPNMGTHDGSSYRPEYRSPSHRLRATRLRKLLLVYLTQLSGRLEWPNPCYVSDWANVKLQDYHHDGESSPNGGANLGPADDDAVLHCWVEITNLMRSGNELLFSTRNHTKDLIQSGRYTSLLEHFQPRLRRWREEFDKLNVPLFMRHILNIEYEYLTVYINSLALQAVVERCANGGANNNNNTAVTTTTTTTTTTSNHLEPSSVVTTADGLSPRSRAYAGNIPLSTVAGLYGGDQGYIKEVVDASRNLLRTVVDGLLPGGYLQHAPVRTYFRIVSGAMFLLKTFALGATEDEVALSLSLMDNTVQALRTCVVDDVHLGIRFADLLDVLTKRIRSRFVRMAAVVGVGGGGGNINRAESRSPALSYNARTSQRQQWQSTVYHHSNATAAAAAAAASGGGGGGGSGSGYLHPLDGRSTPNPLIGISTESIDPGDGNICIMPPPSFAYGPAAGGPSLPAPALHLPASSIDHNNNNHHHNHHPNDPSNNYDHNDDNPPPPPYVADWLALPLDPLLNTTHAAGPGLTQTSLMGPDLGGFDLLEILLNEMEEGS